MYPIKLSVAVVCLSFLAACGSDSNEGASNAAPKNTLSLDSDGVPIIGPQNIVDGKVVMGDTIMTFNEFREKYCFAKGLNATCLEVGRQAHMQSQLQFLKTR